MRVASKSKATCKIHNNNNNLYNKNNNNNTSIAKEHNVYVKAEYEEPSWIWGAIYILNYTLHNVT